VNTFSDISSFRQEEPCWHLPLNQCESLGFELIERHSRTVFRYGRWKTNASGILCRAGERVECNARHFDGIVGTMLVVQQYLHLRVEGCS
jgi:hypothetical protein